MSDTGIVAAGTKAYAYIYDAILSGELSVGSPISENQIANALHISRSPVREALKQMEAEGLVNHIPGRGRFVSQISLQDMEELFNLRILFEMYAIRRAIEHIPEKDLNILEKDFLQLSEISSPQDFYHSNKNLHESIVLYCRNRRLAFFYKQLMAQIDIVMKIYAKDAQYYAITRDVHLQIVRAMKERDLPSAERFLQEHLEGIRDRAMKNSMFL